MRLATAFWSTACIKAAFTTVAPLFMFAMQPMEDRFDSVATSGG